MDKARINSYGEVIRSHQTLVRDEEIKLILWEKKSKAISRIKERDNEEKNRSKMEINFSKIAN